MMRFVMIENQVSGRQIHVRERSRWDRCPISRTGKVMSNKMDSEYLFRVKVAGWESMRRWQS